MLMHWLVTHDWTQIALASSVLALGLVVALEVQAFARLRREVTRDLARIFEQLDLVRFETQQLRESPLCAPWSACNAPRVSAAFWRRRRR
jgi:hypothetical protein